MEDINELFYELMQVAIGNRSCLSRTPSAKDWQMQYAMAKKQSLVGICFAGIQKLEPSETLKLPEPLRLQWLGMAAKIQQWNEIVNRQCVEVQKRLAEAGMRSSILKGQGIAALYRVQKRGDSTAGADPAVENVEILAGLRQSGDIDVYVDCGREKAIEYAKGVQDEVDWDYKHLHLKVFKDTEVEVHYRPEVLMNLRKNRKLQRWFEKQEVQRAMFQVSDGLVAPSVEFNAFYILLHIYRHFLFEGVGLRQLMDYYFVLRTYGTECRERKEGTESGEGTSSGHSLPSIFSLLQTFGMMRFARGVMWIMLYVFEGGKSLNSQPSSLILGIEPDEKEGRYILREVMEGGNFGHHDERNMVNVSGKKGSVLRILRHNWHLLAHYPSEALWAPIYFVWHKLWKMIND